MKQYNIDHDNEIPLDQEPPQFLKRDDTEFNGSSIEQDMQFVIEKTRDLRKQHTEPSSDAFVPAKYRPPQSQSKPVSSSAEDAAVRVADQAKTIVTQTSSVVRKAIAELQRELQELDDILIAYEKQSHEAIDDHLKVSTEAAGAVIGVRQQLEFWKSKIRL